MRRLPSLVVALAACAALLLSGCTGSDGDRGTKEGPAKTLQLLDGQHSTVAAASFQYGAFAVTVGQAVYDEVEKALYVGTRWRNLSDDYATAPLRFGAVQLALGDDAPVPGDVVGWQQSSVPPQATADLTFIWRYLPGDPLKTGVLRFGAQSERVTTVALADGAGEQQLAANTVEVDRWANFGPHTVHVTGGTLGAGHLSNNSQADADHRVLRLSLDVWNSTASRVGWTASDSLALRLPDKTVVKSLNTPTVEEAVWSASEGSWVEFEIPDAAAGDYDLLLFRRAPGVFGLPIVGNSAVPIPIHIDERALAAAPKPKKADLPVPIVSDRRAADGSAPAAPGPEVSLTVSAPAVNVSGCEVALLGGTHSPASTSVELRLGVTCGTPAETAATNGDATGAAGAMLSAIPPSLTLKTALEFDGRMEGALLIASGLTPGVQATTTLRFPDIPADFDPAGAVLHLGRSAWISFAGKGEPQTPASRPVQADETVAGEFTVMLQSYRVGSFTDTDFASDRVELELVYTVTTSSDANQHTLFFNPSRQLMLSRDDGYVTLSSPHDYTGIVELEVGVPKQVRQVFEVPKALLESGTVYVLVRSRDETDFPTPEGWLETTAPVVLTGMAPAGKAVK